MPSAVAKGVALLVLFGGVSPAAGQNNVFANKAALQTAVRAWCANPTAAAATYGPINLWNISQVTDLSNLFNGCSSFNSDISGWDTSIVTTLYVRAASHPLHPSPSDTHALCLAFAYHSLCRVQSTFNNARAFNQPLEAWDVSRVTTLAVRAASHPLHLSPPTRTRCASLLLIIRFAKCRVPSTKRGPSTNPLRRGTSRGSQALAYAPPLVLSTHPLLTRTRYASLLLTIRFAECRLPSSTRMPSTNPSRRGTSRGSLPYSYAPPLLLSSHPL